MHYLRFSKPTLIFLSRGVVSTDFLPCLSRIERVHGDERVGFGEEICLLEPFTGYVELHSGTESGWVGD